MLRLFSWSCDQEHQWKAVWPMARVHHGNAIPSDGTGLELDTEIYYMWSVLTRTLQLLLSSNKGSKVTVHAIQVKILWKLFWMICTFTQQRDFRPFAHKTNREAGAWYLLWVKGRCTHQRVSICWFHGASPLNTPTTQWNQQFSPYSISFLPIYDKLLLDQLSTPALKKFSTSSMMHVS